MIIIPAIDILGGKCVRLVKGEYDSASKVAEDAVETAKSFEAAGASFIHLVDLDGARAAKPVNHELICRVAASVSVPVEVGGGIRSMETVRRYLDGGVERVILGSAALTHPELVKETVAEYGERIAVGIDAKGDYVRTEGWLKDSEVTYTDLALAMSDAGVKYIIYTDIERDGTLKGASVERLYALNRALGGRVNIIASGGVKDINDIRALIKIGVYGAITGKAIYSGSLSLEEAIRECRRAETAVR